MGFTKLTLSFVCIGILAIGSAAYAQAPPEHLDLPVLSEPQPGSAIIPTDIVPLPAQGERASFGDNIQLKILQKLPAKFYFNVTNEESIRTETNPFQYPTKRAFLRQLPPPPVFMNLPGIIQYQDLQSLKLANDSNVISRTLPTITAGWSLTPNTQIFATYFMIRDWAFFNHKINTTVQSIAGGVQHNFNITRNSTLQTSMQFREFYETLQQPVFDFLPSITYSYVLTPRTVVYVNSLLQLRGKKYFQAPTKEIDPFYTAGLMYQKNGWAFSNSMTFVQNFRDPFVSAATIPFNDYSFIGDFEIARRLYRSLPGLQAFVRAEPIWNFASHNRPGLAGMDFRFYYGLRVSAGKPPLTAALQQIREQLKEESPPPKKGSNPPSSTSYLYPNHLTARLPQPIHGYIGDQLLREALGSNRPINLSAVQGSLASHPFVPVRRGKHIAYSHQVVTRGKPSKSPHLHQYTAPARPVVASKSAGTSSTAKTKNKKPVAIAAPVSIAAAPHKDQGKPKEKNKPKVTENKRLARAHTKGEFEMLLIPPLPTVNVQSHDNPFADSGIDVKPPIMLNAVH
jgi:hypothetical protein